MVMVVVVAVAMVMVGGGAEVCGMDVSFGDG